MKKLLIANRGEIAVRIIRTATELGINTVALYAEADLGARYLDLATEAYSLGSGPVSDTYLNIDKIITLARDHEVDAIHPGYGFLSENPDFARRVIDAGITWLGPSPEAITTLGDKIHARNLATSLDVPVIPGCELGTYATARTLDFSEIIGTFAHEVGWPVLIKTSDSGGGRGITRLNTSADLADFLATRGLDKPQCDPANPEVARFLATSFLEKALTRARHVETQCLRDSHGTFQVLTTRDCSIQRRNQKVIEEAPAPGLSAQTEAALVEYSRRLFDAVDYVGAGTCEFLVTTSGGQQQVYFLEVNPRLQVEHTVSEELTGIDLVAEQIRVAEGGHATTFPTPRGHALELRITSEDPANDLMPSTGRITTLNWPGGPGVRIDTHLHTGDTVGADFDSMIAKVIVWGPTRTDALHRASRALSECLVSGVATSIPLLQAVIERPEFDAEFSVYTRWLEESGVLDELKESAKDTAAAEPAAKENPHNFTIEINGRRLALKMPGDVLSSVSSGLASALGSAVASADSAGFSVAAGRVRAQQLWGRARSAAVRARRAAGSLSTSPQVTAPMQGTVVRVLADAGQEVSAGQVVVVMESMKMEKPVAAAVDGVVSRVYSQVGDSVQQGDVLVDISEAAAK